ncbi:hypothetical protein GGQ74_003047 [Desulfobaculum xiamenense]|uniref:Uncharacterized protein n=1 Tax=Desulfobaculum xiamenense TaxID=995050 RepID=A0A846QUX2_9BACT|nr:hypothetical protein [Desulfobaculum xiamenense]NJB69345.1 hypothetical protein [Desulfobaculum xiamenense]
MQSLGLCGQLPLQAAQTAQLGKNQIDINGAFLPHRPGLLNEPSSLNSQITGLIDVTAHKTIEFPLPDVQGLIEKKQAVGHG